jgi:hypothetical protein
MGGSWLKEPSVQIVWLHLDNAALWQQIKQTWVILCVPIPARSQHI